jgi:hypothetical protein
MRRMSTPDPLELLLEMSEDAQAKANQATGLARQLLLVRRDALDDARMRLRVHIPCP